MARLNEQKGERANVNVLNESCRFPAPQRRAPEPLSTSPRRTLKSPTKPSAARPISPDVQQARARQQRSLEISTVDSLLRYPIAGANKSSSLAKAPRESPSRRAKCEAQRSVYKVAMQDDSDVEVAESDWQYSDVSSENSDSDEETAILSRRSPGKANTSPLKGLTEKGFTSFPFVDLTSPAKKPLNVQTLDTFRNDAFSSSRPSSSSDWEPSATIRFSPPQFKRPFKKPAIPESRARTPSPPPSPSKSRLTSPSKTCRIPPTPHRPSIAAFWNPDVVNAWNEEYSPKKVIKSPRKLPLLESSDEEDVFTPTASPRKASPQKKSLTKRDKAKMELKKTFEKEKHGIAQAFLEDMEIRIGGGQISKLTEASGGVKIIWSKKLNSTAGRANWKREGTKSSDAAGEVTTTYKHTASIELAEKVIDDEHRLLNVLAHEYCHLLNFMVSNVKDQPHGASFKRWASKVTHSFAGRGIEVTTKHSYEIVYKYAWVCASDDCATEYERHSKSIDPVRHTCGKCRGKLVQVRPVPRGCKDDGKKQESEYQKFVKDQFAVVRKELDEVRVGEKSPMKDVMKEVGARYRSKKLAAADISSTGSGKENDPEVVEIEDDEEPELDQVARRLDFLTITSND